MAVVRGEGVMARAERDGTTTPVASDDLRPVEGWRGGANRLVRGAMEGLVLAMVCLAPWAFGAVQPWYEFLLDVGVCLLAALWGARILLRGRLPRPDPVAGCLAAMIGIGVVQMIPLPGGVLRIASPAAARMYDQLLPDRPEVLPSGAAREDPAPPAGTTLSLYPGATRAQVARLLAVLLLFAAVADGVASAASLRRLGIVALANGSLLALFGLVQSFSSDDPGLIYWSIPTAGQAFGPFVNRNHFAFHENLCIGLGLGALLARSAARPRLPAGSAAPGVSSWYQPFLDLLRDPASLGMIFGLALMAGSVAFSLSRGGFLALVGGSFVALALGARRSWRSIRGGPILLGVAMALGLASWFGHDQIATRLATLRDGEALEDRRAAVLHRSLPLVKDFPLWGTGYGTFEFADMLHRGDAVDAGVFFEHAHDDYLEVLVEGGLAQLVPGLLAIALILRLGLVTLRGREDGPAAGLMLGALLGFATLLIHGFTDFGLHIPANAVLATVLAAQIVALGRASGAGGPIPAAHRPVGLLPILVAVVAVALGGVVVAEGWRGNRADRLRAEARDSGETFDAASRRRKVAALDAAARLLPGDARIRSELALACFEAHQQQQVERLVGPPASAAGGPAPPATRGEAGDPDADFLVPALRHFLLARDLCPIRATAHMDLADHAGEFASADPRDAYLDRARLLAPGDPDLWYRCGVHELADGRPGRAWASWRHSLALSNRRLPEILGQAATHLDPGDLARLVLPEDPARLVEAATLLAPGPAEARRPLLEAARSLLGRRPHPSAEDLHLRAAVERTLGRPDEAAEALRAALALEPMTLAWRLELAEVLSEQGRFEEARQELLAVVGLRPGDARARALLDEATRKVAEGR